MNDTILTDIAQLTDVSSSLNKTPFLNRSKVKAYALEIAQTRGQKFSRVGASFLERINDKVRQIIASEVRSHPSKGKTLL